MRVKPVAELSRVDELPDLRSSTGSLAQRIHHVLHTAILDLTFPPGTPLRKAELAHRFGVSRAPVTEAIAILAAEGLVEAMPQVTARVTPLSMAALREETFLRCAIEGAVVERLAKTRTDAQLARLGRNLRLQELLVEDGDTRGFFEADEEFHTMLQEFTGLDRLSGFAAQVTLQLHRARQLLLPEARRPTETIVEHGEVLEGIRRQDAPAAVKAMRFHLGQLVPRLKPLEQTYPHYFREG
ncbi:GntR family transcriptional regulator [Meridianimarinicoccus sp. MJW13]|uniref:GntR family transcriptional regulator n=1 Tax=Meridianimarinicoccus sp. MJW13 TaxID=2720031 RepID=UPI001865B86B|nr:GntR family transcriptional regulator [Fluviibacterium sp. MJW13]